MRILLSEREPWWINKKIVADSPSLRLRFANPGPWLPDSSEELLKDARGKEDASGASQLSVRKTPSSGYHTDESFLTSLPLPPPYIYPPLPFALVNRLGKC